MGPEFSRCFAAVLVKITTLSRTFPFTLASFPMVLGRLMADPTPILELWQRLKQAGTVGPLRFFHGEDEVPSSLPIILDQACCLWSGRAPTGPKLERAEVSTAERSHAIVRLA